MIKEKANHEKLIKDFLDSCKQFHEFFRSLSMPSYNDKTNLYEYSCSVNQQIEKLEFIISKLLPILKKGKKLHDQALKDESYINKIYNYLFKRGEELSFFHEDFFIHSRILMDRLALLSSFLFDIKNKKKLVDSFSGYFKFEKNRQMIPIIKEDIIKNLPGRYKVLLSSTCWYFKYLKNPRDQLLVHAKDVKHRKIGGAGFVSGGNSDILDGLKFFQAYPSTIKDNYRFNDVPLLKLLIPKITSFLREYLNIIKDETTTPK